MKVLYVLLDSERMASATTLEGLDDPKQISESTRDGSHVAGISWSAIEHDNGRSRFSVGTESNHDGCLTG